MATSALRWPRSRRTSGRTKSLGSHAAPRASSHTAVNDYTSELTTAATSVQSAINAAIQANATQARNGNLDLLAGEVQQSTLGWTAAGAYYLEIARLNASTLSLLSATPVTTSPTYEGLGPATRPMTSRHSSAAAKCFMTTLQTVVNTPTAPRSPSGIPTTLASAEDSAKGTSVLDRLFSALDLSQRRAQQDHQLHAPDTTIWTDPFGGLMSHGPDDDDHRADRLRARRRARLRHRLHRLATFWNVAHLQLGRRRRHTRRPRPHRASSRIPVFALLMASCSPASSSPTSCR